MPPEPGTVDIAAPVVAGLGKGAYTMRPYGILGRRGVFRILPENIFMAAGAGGDGADGHTDLFLQEEDVILGLLGELVPVGDAADVALPAGEHGVDGLARFSSGVTGKSAVTWPSIS